MKILFRENNTFIKCPNDKYLAVIKERMARLNQDYFIEDDIGQLENILNLKYFIVDVSKKTWLLDSGAELRDELNIKLADLKDATDVYFVDVMSKYSDAERASWILQEQEANAYFLDVNAITPTIDIFRGDVDKRTFCHSVVVKAKMHRQSLFTVAKSQQVRSELKAMNISTLKCAEPTRLLRNKLKALTDAN